MEEKGKKQKRHQQKHSGPKAEKKKLRKRGAFSEEDDRKRNPKAFAVQSAVRMAKTFHRSETTSQIIIILPSQIIIILLLHNNNKVFTVIMFSIYLQGPGYKNQKAPHPSCRPDSSGTSSCCDCSGRAPKGGKEHTHPLSDKKLHPAKAWRHMWPSNHRLW